MNFEGCVPTAQKTHRISTTKANLENLSIPKIVNYK